MNPATPTRQQEEAALLRAEKLAKGLGFEREVASAKKATALKFALEDCLEIMAYYHKSEQGHEDSCDLPDNCGHCLAVKAARKAIAACQPEREANA